MAREKEGYRDTIAQLEAAFPEKGMLTKQEVAAFIGVNRHTVTNMIRFNPATGRVTKADLARQICI